MTDPAEPPADKPRAEQSAAAQPPADQPGEQPAAGPPPEKSAEELAVPLRWLGRAVVVALALWLIMDGLRESWAPAGAIATVLVWVGWALVVAFAAVATTYMARRGRSG